MKFNMTLFKHLCLMAIGALLYMGIEILYRGYTHWTMGVVGGICFISLGLINEILRWDTPLLLQCFIGSIEVTTLEFISGVVLNIWLKLDIWDYSNLKFNILGQVCPQFMFYWFFLSFIAIVIDDYLRYWLFDECEPRYKLI